MTINGPNLTASFRYDALGRRIEKTINGKTTTFQYDGMDIIQERESGAVKANYLRTLGIDEVLARTDANGIRFYQRDQLGSTVALTDENGITKTVYSYDPYGDTTLSGELIDQPFQYTGRENDETGLYYYRARYYSPEMHKFISRDPIGLAGGDVNFYAYVDSVGKLPVPSTNLYEYAGSNPINNTDPLGLFTVSQVPSLIKAGADRLLEKLPQMAFGSVLGRILNGPTSVFGFFAFPDTLASPLQEDPRYRDLFPNIYGYPPGNAPDRFGLIYDPQSGLYLKKPETELRNCKGR